MEDYVDENGKLLPSFYEASRWDIAKSFGLTVIDCAFFFATGGVATYLAFYKSLYIIAYHIIFGYDISPESNAITYEEETYPEGKDVSSKNGSTTRQDIQKQEDQRSDSSPGSDFQEDEAYKSKKKEQRIAFEETPDESELESESQL